MAITRGKKEEILANLIEQLKNSKSVIFADFRGVGVKEMDKLRSELRENGAKYMVAKRTLLKLAAKEAGIGEIPDEFVEGPVGAAFSYEDQVTGAKVLYKLGKEFDKLPLRGGIMDGEIFGADKANQLAQIPSREELLAKLVGSLKSPISGFHGTLYSVMRTFVGTLQAVVDKGGAPIPEEKAEVVAEEAANNADEENAEAPQEEAEAEAPATEE